ncbi:MAG TPA: extracellular solute-binding protein [Streptosporangiaceae bacterium]|nr:extracellular solute-binding protein [Streptosporangiaceae bacterium]
MREGKSAGQRAVRLKPATAACAALGVLVLGAAGCGSSAPASSSSKTVTLNFWSAYNETDGESAAMAHVVIPRFEKENPGIKVNSIVFPYADLLQKYLAAAAAGDPPDLMRSDIAWVPQLASQGVVLKVSSLPWFSAVAKDALPGPLQTTVYQGANYALPLDTNTQALFWNKTDFAAAHISGPPTTMAQMFADAVKLTVKSKHQYGLGVDGTDIWNVVPYIWSQGGALTNASYSTSAGYLNDSRTISAVQKLVSLQKAGDIGTDFLGGTGAVSGEEGFPKGQYAMYIDGPWAVSTYAALKPVPDYGIAQFPTGSAGSFSTVGGEDLVISQGGHNLPAAEKFAQFLESPFAQLAMAKVGQMSALATTAAAEVQATPYYLTFTQQLKTAMDRPVTQNYTKLDADFSAALQEVLAGKMSVSAALTSAAKQYDAQTGS